jgi:hypothetical protein
VVPPERQRIEAGEEVAAVLLGDDTGHAERPPAD